MNFERAKTRLLEPFAVSGILVGLAVVVVRVIGAISAVPRETQLLLLKVSIIVSVVTGMVYAVVSLRSMLRGSFTDRFLYGIVIAIFLSTSAGVLFLM